MKITLSVTERVNLGNFEFVEVSAGIEFKDDEATGEPAQYAAQQLDVLLLSHRRRAQSLLAEDSESFMNYHPALES
jgi:hypothetical protein